MTQSSRHPFTGLLARRFDERALSFALLWAGIVSLALGGLGGSLQPSRLIILGGVALAVIRQRHLVFMRDARPLYVTYAGIITLGLLTLPLSSNVAAGLGLIVTVAIGMAAVLLVRSVPTLEGARLVRGAWTYALLATLPIAVYEIYSGTHFAFALEERNVAGGIGELPYASVFFGNYNNYSTFICLAYPMLLGALLERVSVPRRLFLLAGLALCLAVTLVNTSRIAMLFLAVSTVVALASGVRGSRIWLLLSGVGVFFMVRASGLTWQYLQLRLANDLSADASASERVGLIQASVDGLIGSFGFGLGPGGFVGFVENRYPSLIPNPHNLLLELAVNFSVLAAVLFLGLLAFLFVRTLRNRELTAGLRIPVLVTLPFVPLIGALNSLAVGYTYWWYWLASALYIALARAPQPTSRAGRGAGASDSARQRESEGLRAAQAPF